jgi:hypothetical protein
VKQTHCGVDTESLRNLRVACASCNIRKGRGYTKASVVLGLCNLIRAISNSRERPRARGSRSA